MNKQTIYAKVSPKLLTKAERLFTGTIEGRIIELLQNARRAGATEVKITNRGNRVTVRDNGCGIKDFQKLLELGLSGWDENIETGEDPAGVGLFSLAPRDVIIASGSSRVFITKGGWAGQAVTVQKSDKFVEGTVIEFTDERSWDFDTVEKYAVFAETRVIVDGKYCRSLPFCGEDSAEYKDLGCRIAVAAEISNYHKMWRSGIYGNRPLVNFHGQIVQMEYWPGQNRHGIYILVDLTSQTSVRLLLPARTCLVEDKALDKLKEAIEIEYYRYFQRQKQHDLIYDEYLRAKELRIELAQAKETFRPGLIHDEYDMVAEVILPDSFKLSDGYLCLEEDFQDDYSVLNAHLLGAVGTFEKEPFIPVRIEPGYREYNWANLSKVTKVDVDAGKELIRSSIQAGEIICVESLAITVHTSDGKQFSSPVPMALGHQSQKHGKIHWSTDIVYVTAKARELDCINIWYHLGGYDIDGDCFETQQHYFEKELDAFWNDLAGPYEGLRQNLMNQMWCIRDNWTKLVLTKDGCLEIHLENGMRQYIGPESRSDIFSIEN